MGPDTMAGRRNLVHFSSLADVVADAQDLHRRGYEKVGQWDLSQVLQHCADWIDYGIDGYPSMPLPLTIVFWFVRRFRGRRMLETMLAQRSMDAGGATLGRTVHPPSDEADALARFERSVQRLETFSGPTRTSPLFGPLSVTELQQLNVVHCAHHLSFLVPKSA